MYAVDQYNTSCHASHQYIHTWDTEMLTCTPLHTYLLVHLTMYVSHHVSSAGRYIHDMRYIHHEIHTPHHVLIICTTHHQVVYTTWSAGSMYTSSSCTVHHVYQLLYLHTYHMIYIHMICCIHTTWYTYIPPDTPCIPPDIPLIMYTHPLGIYMLSWV